MMNSLVISVHESIAEQAWVRNDRYLAMYQDSIKNPKVAEDRRYGVLP